MWTLLVLFSVIAFHGVQGADRFRTTNGIDQTLDAVTATDHGTADSVQGAPCGGHFYGESGVFYSPNYPNRYPPGANCIWYITPGSRNVQLTFPFVDLEAPSTCAYDYIYVYDGPSISSRLLGQVCGMNSTSFNSTGPSLTVKFRSDGSGNRFGFRAEYQVVDSCRHYCGYQFANCSCSSSCGYRGNCCPDYEDYCLSTSAPATAQRSCRYNCGSYVGSCSCTSSCRYQGNCCHDYNNFCSATTPGRVTARPSCHYNCGRHMGSCSCSSSCQYYGNCCFDYYSACTRTTETPVGPSTGGYSCRYNCGNYLGSCSCTSSCRYQGNCCHDYNSYCQAPATPTAQASCRYNCGSYLGSCSCTSSCRYQGNCCHDYNSYCQAPATPTAQASCRYNCGSYLGSCSCTSSCRYQGNCCHDYNSYCQAPATPTAQASCRYNCGSYLGSCSCTSSCRYQGNCCHDYNSYCQAPATPTAQASCRYNCGSYLGSCSCTSSCRYQGNCCHDYNSYCQAPATPTAHVSCRNNCGRHMGSCSCSSSCRYQGNCCYDFYSYCQVYTDMPATASPCGGSLYGSGTFSSPNHPNYYQDNAYCVWQLRAAYDQRIFLAFTYLQLENCCSCDYIAVYDGPSVGSRYLGKVCNNSLSTFYSTSNYLTVVLRTDGSVVGRGFNADFISSLLPSSGRVACSSDNMTIVIQRSYLSSLGYDGQNLYLNDPDCRPQVSRYQVVFTFPINNCGTVGKFENGRVVYSNTIRASTSSSGEITRQSHLKMSVGCRMDQDSVAQIMYIVHHHDNSSITGTGRFNTSMGFYTSSNFYYKVTQVPYLVALNQDMYVQVDLTSGDSSLVLFLDTCVTSPSPDDFQSRSYYLVRNGCPVDNTYRTYISGTRSYARFSFKAFQFLRATESVYIQCKVLICQASDYNSRCRRGCNRRAARGLGSEHDSHTLVLGPIQLKDPEKKEGETHKQNVE